MKWLDAITNLTDMSVSERQELVMDREAWRAAAHGVTKEKSADLACSIPTRLLGIRKIKVRLLG